MKPFIIFVLSYCPTIYILYKIMFKDFDDLNHGIRVYFTPSSLDWIWTTKDYNQWDVMKDDMKAGLFVFACIALLIGDLILIDKYIGF